MVAPTAAQGQAGRVQEPGKRSRARGRLLGAGAVLAGAGLFLAGLSLGLVMNSPPWETGAQGASEQSAGAGAPGSEGGTEPSGEPEEPASGDRELDPAEGVPRFSQAHEGDWEGVADNGAVVELQTQEGDQSGELDIDLDDCEAVLNLSASTDRGYDAVVSFDSTEPARCVLTRSEQLEEQVAVIVEGDTMAIDFFGEGDVGGEPVTTLSLARVD